MNKVAIGIPAYNEESNIKLLLKELLLQEEKDFSISKIIVNSDGSTDNTVALCHEIKDDRIVVIDNISRTGVAVRQNEIIQNYTYDILVLINADTRIRSKNFINKLISPIMANKADLVSPKIVEAPTTSILDTILLVGNSIKREVFESFNKGDNWFNCHGAARAFSAKFLKEFRFKESISEDLYPYLYCVINGYKFKYVSNPPCYYALPTTLRDHLKQNKRFFGSPKYIQESFKQDQIKKYVKWPIKKIVSATFHQLLINPVYTFMYVLLFVSNFTICHLKTNKVNNLWSMSKSTRKVNI